MSGQDGALEQEVDRLYEKLEREAEEGGYHLNPDREFTRELLKGLVTNIRRYGYMACPCRLAAGERQEDLDIICPCDYRDPDLNDHDTCYCALYVSREVKDGKKNIGCIPERRPPERSKRAQFQAQPAAVASDKAGAYGDMPLPYPVWRCRVCGYLCAREQPPGVCPVCKASRDRFERFL